jgi:hypothetical protein
MGQIHQRRLLGFLLVLKISTVNEKYQQEIEELNPRKKRKF